MSKELLEEIIENVEEIMETPYVARKEKAEEVGIDLIMSGKVDFLLRKIDSLEKQNKRYRETLEDIINKAKGDFFKTDIYITASEALEDEE